VRPGLRTATTATGRSSPGWPLDLSAARTGASSGRSPFLNPSRAHQHTAANATEPTASAMKRLTMVATMAILDLS